MTIKEIAAAFDMSVTEFARLSGYKRQHLYDGVANSKRSEKMLINLLERSSEIYDADIARAYDKQTKRIAAIEAFATNIREEIET